MKKLDYKVQEKELYNPQTKPALINVPQMTFICIDGRGNPNDQDGEYQKAVEALYGLTYTIKMSAKSGIVIDDYFDYVVPPLEGLWWIDDCKEFNFRDKAQFCWTAMIRQPEFVTEKVFQQAKATIIKKKPELDISKLRLALFIEGLCVQCMHIGSFDDEPTTITKINEYIEDNNLINDLSDIRRHHEIYLSNPQKAEITKMKTIIRLPVKNNHI